MGQLLPALPGSIREINDLSLPEKEAIYRTLVPEWICSKYGIDPVYHAVGNGQAIRIRCPRGSTSVELSVFHDPLAYDPVLYLHMGDNFNSQLIVLLVIINDPAAPRFNVDTDEMGRPIRLGSNIRNVPEEIRAMQAGLAPGQVRSGLRVFRTAIPAFEQFVRRMGHDLFFIEPLFYHNAITFERYGFNYSRGLGFMRDIHASFLPGGELHDRLDGSTPFRQPDAWQTVRGRSWAIHDGVLGSPFTGVQMYKRLGVEANVVTFPGAAW